MKRALIEDVALKSGQSSHANLPKLVTFASSDTVPDGAKFANFRSTEDGSLLLTSSTERLSYVNKTQPEQLMLAVVNKTTGKARLVPLESYHLSPVLEPSAPQPAAEAPQYSWVDVGKAFGLARWQKNHQRSTRLNVGSGSRSVAQSLEAAAEYAQQSQPPQEAAEEGEDVVVKTEVKTEDGMPMETGLVPQQNLAATEPSEVYSREDVVPSWLNVRLKKSADQFDAAIKKLNKTDEFLVRQADIWRDSDEDRFALSMYAFYLTRLLRTLQDMFVTKNWKRLMIPEPVLEHLRESFMERSHNGWDRSERLLDKLVCHLIVVELWICDYSVSLNDLSGISRVKLKKLMQYCSLLGLTVSGDKALLRLPLKLKTAPQTSRRIIKTVASM